MKCKKCGEELPENARFCPGCGSPVEGVPAPKKLEEPLNPLAAGAVPLVPIAPPPRASRMTSRGTRPYVPRSNQRTSGYSASSRYGSSYIFGRRGAASADAQSDEAAKPKAQPQENAREAVAERPSEAAAEKHERLEAEKAHDDVRDKEAAVEPAVEPEAVTATEPAVEPEPEAESVAKPESAEAPAQVDEPVAEAPAAPAPETEPDLEDDDLSAEKTGRLRPVSAPEPAPAPVAAAEGPSPLERAKELAGRAKDFAADVAHEAADRFEALGPDKVPAIAVALVVLAVVGVALAYISTGWFSPFADRTVETPQFEEPSDGSVEPIQPEQAEEEEPEGPIEGGPEIRDTLQAYSWTELSQLSALIAAAPSDEEGLEIARLYNLCAESGSIDANNVKNLELSSGAVVPVAIGGFRHDTKSDGSGVAGITFITRASVGNQAVDPSGIATAWEETPLRSWLNQSLMAEIPTELAELVVAVDKTTNLPMAYGSGQSVTSEYLWIPSYSEVVGPLDSSNRRYGIYQSEGEQYQLYTDSGVTSVGDNATLALGEYWWTRSPDVVTDYWYLVVSPEGGTPYGHRTGTPDAIILGFCI